jgi:hypothetical protein
MPIQCFIGDISAPEKHVVRETRHRGLHARMGGFSIATNPKRARVSTRRSTRTRSCGYPSVKIGPGGGIPI